VPIPQSNLDEIVPRAMHENAKGNESTLLKTLSLITLTTARTNNGQGEWKWIH